MVRLSTGKQVSAGFALSFLLLVVIGLVQFRTIQHLVEAGRLVARTNAVIGEIEGTLAAVAEARIANRGYLITREPLELRSYESAELQALADIRILRALTADNPRQQVRLNTLESLIKKRFAGFQQVLTARDQLQAASKFELFDRDEGLQLINSIRLVASDMENEERHLLAQRTAASETRARQTVAVTALGVLAALAFLMLASWMIQRDLRARERAEAALELRTEELVRSNSELEQFAYVASHDLQEPLRMVSSYTQLLAQRYKGKLGSDADDFIAYSVDGARRMQTLIQDLLAYSRLNTRRKFLAPTDCGMALDKALTNLRAPVEESGAVITRDPLPTVLADASQIAQLFQNLIGNAIKYRSERPPRIHISAATQGDRWTFTVRDNGIGIEQQYAERIFVIFQRLHSRKEYPGTGIGLAVCKKIVENHRGTIWMESTPGQGSTFFFSLPAKDSAGRADEETSERTAA